MTTVRTFETFGWFQMSSVWPYRPLQAGSREQETGFHGPIPHRLFRWRGRGLLPLRGYGVSLGWRLRTGKLSNKSQSIVPVIYHAEYPAVSVRANFSISLRRDRSIFYAMLPLAEAAYLASIVIDRHTCIVHCHANEVWTALIVLFSTISLGHEDGVTPYPR
jgi:hypothetical protein